MRFNVFWTRFAELKLDDIFNFYKSSANKLIALKIINRIIDKSLLLENFPLCGQKEDLLNSSSKDFRYLVSKNFKIIYWINHNKQRIEIVNVFDARQNPKNILM